MKYSSAFTDEFKCAFARYVNGEDRLFSSIAIMVLHLSDGRRIRLNATIGDGAYTDSWDAVEFPVTATIHNPASVGLGGCVIVSVDLLDADTEVCIFRKSCETLIGSEPGTHRVSMPIYLT